MPVVSSISVISSYPSVLATFLVAGNRGHVVSILSALENHLQAFDPTANEELENRGKAKCGSDLRFLPSYEELKLRIPRLEAEMLGVVLFGSSLRDGA